MSALGITVLSLLILTILSGMVWVFRKNKVDPSDYNHRDYTGPDPSRYSEYQQDKDEDNK
jgi:hypothetical protein